MEMSKKDFDGNAFTVDDDKDGLISNDEGPVIGKGGHVIESRGSVDSQKDGSNRESSPLHSNKKGPVSGKDLQTSHGLRIIVGVAIGFSVLVTIALILTIYLGHGQGTIFRCLTSSSKEAKISTLRKLVLLQYLGHGQVGASGAVVSDSTECSKMGLAILEQGGNAVDAAVATMFCVGVVNPDTSGIGGGGFMMVHDHKTQAAKVFDFRETAPQSATRNMFHGLRKNAEQGGRSVAIPGELKGMELAHKRYGKLPWSAVVKPAADLARNGFKVNKNLAKSLQKCDMKDFVGTNLAIYLTVNNTFVEEGVKIKNVHLAGTLDIIGEKGSKAYYDGELTTSILNAVNKGTISQIWSEDDLKNYEVIVRDVVKTTYHDQILISVPAPASGPALLSIMNILEGYNFKSSDRNTTPTVHRILEAFKFGYAQQQSLADPKFELSVFNSTVKMLSKSEAKLLMNRTTDKAHSGPAFYDGVAAKSTERRASHVSVIDAQELMVSVTTSVNDIFGSQVMTDTGILLNNQMADFADPENNDTKHMTLNYIAPGKRPLSNMSPLILYNQDSPCQMRLVVGGENGSRIISGVAQVLLNVVSFGLKMADAIAAPRLHTQVYPKEVEYEDGFPQKVVEELKLLGHDMVKVKDYISVVQGIKKVNNRIHAVADPRKGGKAAMFNSNNS